jgi:colanic acid biosynthesis glycosyl transferase WcaI
VKKILILTQWFEPEPAFKGLTFAKELRQQGFEVEVVTGFPNYPGGKVYYGYKIRLYQKEIMDGIIINRLPLYPSHDRSVLRRIINYVSFSITSLFYIIFFTRSVDVIYVYHPPLTVGFVAAIYKLIRRTKMVLDVQDLWPDTLNATGMIKSKKIIYIVGIIAKLTYCISDKIVVLSEGFKNRLISRGVKKEKIKVIRNWADEEKLNKKNDEKLIKDFDERYLNIVFAGNVGKAQALHTILEAAAILEKKGEDVRFIIIGGGVELEKIKELSKTLNLKNVIFLPKVEMEEVGTYLRNADILLVHINKNELFEITIPSKIQAYMAIGKPILLGVKGDAARIIKEANCGIMAEPENPISISEAVLKFKSMNKNELETMGANGKEYYYREMSIEVGVRKFAKIFMDLIK